ncbi:MAG TPA: energy transducer TonB, partial [Thermoanaerobaculia bacterium]|nr:energy transducer TonB [Thermoanaerobaculia bacterium]
PPPLPTPQPGVVGGIDIPIGSAGVTGIEGDFPYTIYIDRMKTLIGLRWTRPHDISGVTTTVSFTIERDGTIRDAKSEILSGNGTFDRAALRAVLEASPLPPLPFGYNGTFLGVHLTFR